MEDNLILSLPNDDNIITSPPNPILSPPADVQPPEIESVDIKPAALGSEKEISTEKLPPILKAGINLAIGVGTVITIIIFAILAQVFILVNQSKTDSVASLQSYAALVLENNAADLSSDIPEKKENAQNNIKAAQEKVNQAVLNDSTWTRITTLFDSIVVKALLPIFTTILGYIFGSRAVSDDNS